MLTFIPALIGRGELKTCCVSTGNGECCKNRIAMVWDGGWEVNNNV